MMDDSSLRAMDVEALAMWRMTELRDDESSGADGVSERQEAFGFFLRVLGNAVDGRPPLMEMGYRTWIMAARYAPGVCPHSSRSDLHAMRKLAAECNGHLSLGHLRADLARDVFEFVLGAAATAERMGKRVSILAYGINTSAAVRAALPSMESIGTLWGLRADNKRSAVSAAAKKMLRETREKMERRDVRHRNVIAALWYAKRAVTLEKYAEAQKGNHNRGAKPEQDLDEQEAKLQLRRQVAEVRRGIPVRPEWAGLTPEQVNVRLRQLREAADIRRLAGL